MKNQLANQITFCFVILLMFFGAIGVNAQKSIVFLSNNTDDARDDLHVEFLENQGFDVTRFWGGSKISTWGADTITMLNAADLVILGRSIGSGETQQLADREVYNALTVPVMMISPWGVRNNRNHWFNSGGAKHWDVGGHVADINLPGDTIFSNVTLDAGNKLMWFPIADDYLLDTSGDSQGEWVVSIGDTIPVVVRFEANKAFYAGGPDSAVAERVYFGFGIEPSKETYFAISQAAKQVYLNEVSRLVGDPVKEAVYSITDKSILFLTDDENDSYTVEFLKGQGFSVETFWGGKSINEWGADTLAMLNKAELIILGRSLNSGEFSDSIERVFWNAIEAPVVYGSPYFVRNNRNHLFNSGTATTNTSMTADILMPADPIFDNVTVEAGNTLPWFYMNSNVLKMDSAAKADNQGEIVAAIGDSIPLIVRFEANKAFYAGGPDSAAAPRYYFGFGIEPYGVYTAQQSHFPLTKVAKQVYLNEIASILGVDSKIAGYNTWDYDIIFFANDERDLRSWEYLEEQGFKVNVITGADTIKAGSWSADTVALMNAADLLIIGRSVGSAGHSAAEDIQTYDSLTIPVMHMSPWSCRSSRNNWFNSTGTGQLAGPSTALANMPDDIIFSNVKLDADSFAWAVTTTDIIGNVPMSQVAGNIVASIDTATPLIVRFPANTPYYTGAPYQALAERVYFGFGTEPNAASYFPLADITKQVWFNEVSRIVGLPMTEAVIPTYAYEGTIANVVDGEIEGGAEDFTGTFTFLYDEESLYLTISIVDDSIYLGDAASYVNDNIEIYFDMDNSKTPNYPRDAGTWPVVSYDDNDYQLRLVPEAEFSANNSLGGVTQVYTETADGYMFELTFSWDSLMPGFTPTDGTLIGFDILASDNDGDGRNQITFLTPSSLVWTDASMMGTVELSSNSLTVVADREKPSVPGNVAADGLTVTWDPSTDNTAIFEYIIFDGDAQVDTVLALASGNTYTLSDLAAGIHTIGIQAVDNYGNKSDKGTVDIEIVSVEKTDNPLGLNVYPNPAFNNLMLESAVVMSYAQIFNTNGQLVKSVNNINAKSIRVDISELSQGIYNVRVVSSENEVSNLILIKK